MDLFIEDGFDVVAHDDVIALLLPKGEYDTFLDIGLLKTGEIIGYISYGEAPLRNVTYEGNVGYEIYKKYRGNNYALRALKLIKDVLLEEDINDVFLNISPKNIASRKTAERFGAKILCYRPIPKNNRLYNYNDEHMLCVYKQSIEPKEIKEK